MYTAEIPIFFAIDEGYAPFLGVALHSAIDHASPERHYRAIILHQNVSDANQKRLKAQETDFFKIEFVPMEKGLETITDRGTNRLRCDYFTLTIYFRLFIAMMFPQYDKALYLDSDIVLMEDVANLYDVDLGTNLIGACPDVSVVDVPVLAEYMEKAVGVDRHRYINSGVLVMNLKALRQEGFAEHFLRLMNEHQFETIAPDQDYINAICQGRILYLDGAWDRMPAPNKPTSKPKLIHYNLFSKPWCYDGVQYGEYFWYYAYDSGFFKEIMEYKLAYSQEKMNEDAHCMERMLEEGARIAVSEHTFRTADAKGGVRL